MNEVIKNILERRSVRNYTDKLVDKATLDELLNVAIWSPNAGNKQRTRIVVSQDQELNTRLGKAQNVVYGQFNGHKPIVLNDEEIAKTSHSGFYNAPTVIYMFAPDNFLFAEPDSYIMAQDICLAATSIGVDSCIISVATDYFIDDFGKDILKKWDIPEGYHISAHVILGYHEGNMPAPKDRKYNEPLFVGVSE